MRVAYVCADPGVPVFGSKGCSVHVREVIAGLLEQGADVTLFARNVDGEIPERLKQIQVVPLPALPKSSDAGARELKALAGNADLLGMLRDRGPFDIVYERYSLWSTAAMEHAYASGIPGLLEVNAPLIEEQMRYRTLVNIDAAEATARTVFRTASALLAVSSGVRDYLCTMPGTTGKVHLVPNGVDVDRFCPSVAPALGDSNVTTVGFLGGLKPWHGVELLIQAFVGVSWQVPNIRLLIVGDGPQRALLQSMAACHPACNIVFTSGIDPSQVPAYLASIDIGVAPYPDLDGFYFSPLKVYEYMAMGMAVVASNIGDMPCIIDSGVSGMLTAPGDIADLQNALLVLLSQPQTRLSMGAAARRQVSEKHTWTATTRRILQIAEWSVVKAKVAI